MIGVKLPPIPLILFASIFSISYGDFKLPDTLPALKGSVAPTSLEDMWIGFDPKAEPLDVEILKEWEEDGVKLKVLRYRIGVFKGQKAMMAAVYGYPKNGKSLSGKYMEVDSMRTIELLSPMLSEGTHPFPFHGQVVYLLPDTLLDPMTLIFFGKEIGIIPVTSLLPTGAH